MSSKYDKKKWNRKLVINTLRFLANEDAYRYLSPTYLVGSFLTNPEKARDIDIMLVMTEDRMMRLFDDVSFNHKRFMFRKAQKHYYESHIGAYDFDFKVVSQKEFTKHKGKKLKLDNVIDMPE